MKVLIVNGSPHKEGCTYTALKEVEGVLNDNGIDTQWVWIGNQAIHGCIACGACRKKANLGRCIFDDGNVNEIIEKLNESDGLLVGAPVYFASVNGAISAILDRVFYANNEPLDGKVGASIVSCRRGGSSVSYDRLNKYFGIRSMPIATSQYWNGVHGNTPDEVRQDLEGMQIMRILGRNMAWMIKAFNEAPELERDEAPVATNFIR